MRHRVYVDKENNLRKILYIGFANGLVPYRYHLDIRDPIKQVVYSPAELWHLEDGSLVQIPTEAWDFCGIDYKDYLT